MQLNCRPGDLAVIVRSYAGNEGKIVMCLRLRPNWRRIGADGSWREGPGWETDTLLAQVGGGAGHVIADCQLRPLRDSEGQDEMLRIAGRPQERERI